MKRSIKCLALWPLLSAPILIHTSIEHIHTGTVVYSKWFKGEIIVAADSRAKGDNGYKDDECKITTYKDKAFFAFSGFRSFEGSSKWDAHNEAKKAFAFADTQRGTQNKAFTVATFWKNRTEKVFQFVLDNDPETFMRLVRSQNGLICDAIFAVRNDHEFSVVTVEMSIVRDGKRNVIEAKFGPDIAEGGDIAIGQNRVIQEILADSSFRAHSANLNWRRSLPNNLTPAQVWELFSIQLIQWTIDFKESDKVGGYVNAAVLDSNGIRWLRQAEYCKSANQ